MRILGLDVGDVRIGVGISDPLKITAQPLTTIPNTDAGRAELKKIVDDYDVVEIVVGYPTNRFGKKTKQTEVVELFAKRLEEDLSCKITYWDERYSTKAVERVLIEADVSRKNRKKVIDQQAAVFFLQGYLDGL